jgi:hypothetical protein
MSGSSWVVSDKTTGRALVEIFDRDRAEAVNRDKFLVEPITQYLARMNREIKTAQKDTHP